MKRFLMTLSSTATVALMMSAIPALGQVKTNYTQTMTHPTQLFPELSGWHGGLQVNNVYRVQWPGLPLPNKSLSTSVDGYSYGLNSGFGLNFYHSESNYLYYPSVGNGLYLNIAPKLPLKNGMVLMPAFSAQCIQINISPYAVTYAPLIASSVTRITAGIGLGAVYKQIFLVAHSDYFTQPMVSFFRDQEMREPRTYQFLAGRNFNLGPFVLTPNIVYQRYGEFNHLNFAFNAQYEQFYIGGMYRYGDALGFAAGYELMKRFRLSYCYDITVSQLGVQTLGSHELALRMWFFKDRTKKQFLQNLPIM